MVEFTIDQDSFDHVKVSAKTFFGVLQFLTHLTYF